MGINATTSKENLLKLQPLNGGRVSGGVERLPYLLIFSLVPEPEDIVFFFFFFLIFKICTEFVTAASVVCSGCLVPKHVGS